MGSISLPTSFNATKWMADAKDPKQATAKPLVDKVRLNLDNAQKGQAALKAVNADTAKLKSAAEIQQRISEVTKEQETFKSIKSAVDNAVKASADYVKAAGKDINANAKKQADGIQKEGASYVTTTARAFDDTLKTLQGMLDKVAKPPAAKAAPAGGGASSKADDQLLMKLSKKAVAFAMKPKPGVKPMQFAIIGKKGTPIKLLMGTKTEVAKLIGKFWKPDPATKKKPMLAKDPMSKVLFDKGALIFESAKISNGYLGSMKKALVIQIKKSPKLKWRKPGMPDEEAPGGGDELKAEDVHVEEEKASDAELTKAKTALDKVWPKIKSDKRIATRSAADKAEIADYIKEIEKAVKDGDYVEALDVVDAIDAMLDATPAEEDTDDAPAATAKSANATTAAKTANAPAAKSATGAAAAPQPAAKSTGAAAGKGDKDLSALADSWVRTRDAAIKEVEGLKTEIQKLYPKGDPSVQAAMKQLDGSVAKMKVGIDAALKGAAGKAEAQRATLLAAAKSKVTELIGHIDSDSVMANLDNNEVKPISAGARLRAGLKTLQDALN